MRRIKCIAVSFHLFFFVSSSKVSHLGTEQVPSYVNESQVFCLCGAIWGFMSRKSCADRMKVPYLYNKGRYFIALFCMLKHN